MSEIRELPDKPVDPRDDCPLPVNVQRRNIACFATYWGIVYLTAPITYVGLVHSNLLNTLKNNDTICNFPSAVYLWMTIVPVVIAWRFPQPRFLKLLSWISISLMAAITAAVAATLWFNLSPMVTTIMVIGHAAVFGMCNGVLMTALWDSLRRGVSTSRRGAALGFAFGAGPVLACVGALLQDAVFDGKMLGGWSFGLQFPHNYLAMFAAVAPLLMVGGCVLSLFTVPIASVSESGSGTPLVEIISGVKQFARNRTVLFAVVIYVIVYSGGNAIFANVSLHAKDLLGDKTDTVGAQTFLRFGFKAVTGVVLGCLLATASPRATLIATTSILLFGMGWALNSNAEWFLLTFGLLGSGELFGAYFPNYVTTASEKKFVRVNMAYLGVLNTLTGFSSLAFGLISDSYGRIASFYVSAGMLVLALLLITLLPADPTPHESTV